MKKLHSKFGASKSERWLNCPGSVSLEERFPESSSVYADEGSAAHRLAEKALISNQDVSAYAGTKVLMESGFSYDVSAEMIAAVSIYVQEVKRVLAELPKSVLNVETPFHLKWIHKDLWGTN